MARAALATARMGRVSRDESVVSMRSHTLGGAAEAWAEITSNMRRVLAVRAGARGRI